MGQEEKNYSVRDAERVRIRSHQGSVGRIPRVSLENSVVSKVKWVGYFVNLVLILVFAALAIGVSMDDSVPLDGKIVVSCAAIIVILFTLYYLYSIPTLVIDNQSIQLKIRGKIKQKIALEDVESIEYFADGKGLWLGAVGHRIYSKKECTILFNSNYYANSLELLLRINGDSNAITSQNFPLRFSPYSIFHLVKIYRSFGLIYITSIGSLFIYCLLFKNNGDALIHHIVFGVLTLIITMCILGLIKIAQYVNIEGKNIVQHFPLLLMSRSIPKESIEKMRLQSLRTGKGNSKSLLILLKDLTQINIKPELNSKDEIKKIEKQMNISCD